MSTETEIAEALAEFRRWLNGRPRYAGSLVVEATPGAVESLVRDAFMAGASYGREGAGWSAES